MILAGVTCWLGSRPDRHARIPSGVADLEVVRGLPYSDRTNETILDLYLPAAGTSARAGLKPLPVILAIHGGSWVGGSRTTYGPQLARLASRGYAVAVPDYGLSRPNAPGWPQALDDLREAVRWLRRNAATHGLDPGRIAAMGSGAGAHLALLLGTAPPATARGAVSSRVQAVIDLYGPTDLGALLESRSLDHDPLRRLIGPHRSDALADASPVSHVSSDDPPILIVHGTDDLWVPLSQSRRLADRLEAARVLHRLIVVPGARHGFELLVGGPEPRDLLPDITSFLESVWQSAEQISLGSDLPDP